MAILEFEILGDLGTKHKVVAKRTGDNLTIICDCENGKRGDLCRHRMALLHGDANGLASDNLADVLSLGDFIIGTDVEGLMIQFARTEALLETVKHDLDKLRVKLAEAMMD